MAPKYDLAAAGLGTPAQNRQRELARRRARKNPHPLTSPEGPSDSGLSQQQPSSSAGLGSAESGPAAAEPQPESEPEPELGPELGPLTLEQEVSKLRSDNEKHRVAEVNYHELLAERDTTIATIQGELADVKDALRKKQIEATRISSSLSQGEQALKETTEALQREQTAHKKTQQERDQSIKLSKEHASFIEDRNKVIRQKTEMDKATRAELNAVKTDLDLAQKDIDARDEQIKVLKIEEEQLHGFMQAVHQVFEQQFEEQGVTLTPDMLIDHIRHTSQLATTNRNVSGNSDSSSLHDGTHRAGRPSTGQRKVSVAQELAEVNMYDESGDEDDHDNEEEEEHPSTGNNLYVPKRRPQPETDGVGSASFNKDAEKEQKIREQADEIEKLRQQLRTQLQEYQSKVTSLTEEHQKEAVTLNEQHQNGVARLKEEHQKEVATFKEEYQKEVATQQERLEAAAKEMETCRVERVKLSTLFSSQQDGTTSNQVIKHDAATQTPAIETEEQPATATPAAPTQIIRYTEVVRDATLWEAFMRSPFWQQLLILLCSLILLHFGIWGWSERRMWLTANGSALHQVRYNQAQRAVSGIWTRLEENIGYNSRLLA